MSKSLEIEKVANLTPLQEGMLFHTVMEPESQAYYEQVRMTIRGELNLEALQKSFQTLVQRHEALRSNIYHQSASRSRLIVFKERNAVLRYENLINIPEAEQAAAIRSYADTDRNQRYDLSKDLLIRLTVLQTKTHVYTLLLSFHHIIMDGWCLGIVMEELFAAYEALKAGKTVQLPTPQPYTGYARWLDKQDKKAAKEYWQSILNSYDQPAVLPTLPVAHSLLADTGYLLHEHKITLTDETTRHLRTVAEHNGTTLSSLFLAAWGVVLGGYNQSEDVVFGTVVSGRPPELAGVEQMLGLFINTMPVRIKWDADQPFSSLLREVQRNMVQSRAYDYCSLAEIQAQSVLKQQLMDHFVVFENYPLEDIVGRPDLQERLGFVVEDAQLSEETPYHFNIEVEDGKALGFMLSYNSYVYSDEAMKRLAGHLEHVLVQIAHAPELPLEDIRLLTASEKAELTNVWSGPVAAYPAGTFHGIFEAQAERVPEQTAVIYEDTALTYHELNEKANLLAQALQSRGVEREHLVAVMLERSADMIIAVLGIMKAGAAYVPVDPTYPKERITYMLQDSRATIMLTQSSLTELLADVDFVGEVLDLPVLLQQASQAEQAYQQGPTYTPIHDPEALAYVIYTSGTTGNAKGVMIEHRHYVNTAWGYREAHQLKEFPVKLLQIASMSFDVFAGDLAKTFVNGGTMVICPQDVRNDPPALAQVLEQHKITTFEAPPALLTLLMDYVYEHGTDVSAMKLLTTGADSFGVDNYRTLLNRFGDTMRIMNTYGVTEAAIDSSFYEETAERMPSSGIVPIGKALPNHKVYILDEALRPLPIGVAGELCLGGASVARGYLHRPDLTAEKFVPNPFVNGERLYRTGDLARWLPDGNIDFIGRVDFQVKIRGYRIELGEIESALLQLDEVRQVVVTDRTDKGGQKYLCAYVAGAANKSFLRTELAKQLPSYMVPAHIIVLDQLPLTHNGKIDRHALPEPEDFVLTDTEYEAPRSKLEQTLASIWEEVLGVKPIGLRNNFFELGGDSIKALQIAARLNAKGLKMDMKDLFRHPQIDLIVPYIKTITRIIPQGAVQGAVELTPIQWEFFEYHQTERHHYNQVVMLQNTKRWNETWLRSAMDKLTTHHDALRITFDEREKEPVAYNRGTAEGECFTLESYNLLHADQPEAEILQLADALQRGFDLRNGPLVRLALFRLQEADHLLIVIHHLVVDGVSWKILLEDLEKAYQQAANGQKLQLPAKTDSYKEWAARLSKYAHSAQVRQEINYWNEVEAREIRPLPKDHEVSVSLIRDAHQSEVTLSREETENLLKHAHHAYNTEINDILLTALGLAFYEWSGHAEIAVQVASHNRTDCIKDIDVSRTVGRFTSVYPFVIHVSKPEDQAYQIKLVKDNLRRVPNQGAGYGILRYLTNREQQDKTTLFSAKPPEISFSFDEETREGTTWRTSALSMFAGSAISPLTEKAPGFGIHGVVAKERLSIVFEYNAHEYEESTVTQLTASFKNHLIELIRHCCAKETAEQSPTDFTYGQLSLDQFENIANRLTDKLLNHQVKIKDLYPLSPMQEGMLFHAIADEKSEAYFEQTIITIHEAMDTDLISRSLQRLIDRYDIFRTVFVYKETDRPLQVVLEERSATPVHTEDVRGLPEAEKQRRLQAILQEERQRGFDLEKEVLIRLALVQWDEDISKLIWISHHIIMDGWCLRTVAKDFFEIYTSLRDDTPLTLEPVYPFSSFIQWLKRQNKEEAAAYWNHFVDDFENETVVPGYTRSVDSSFQAEQLICTWGEQLTQGMEQIAKQNRVTVSTLFQTVWGLLLQAYNNSNDVIFGSVVSGRPDEIPGIENMIGLFINTIPVRIKSSAELRFSDLLTSIQDSLMESNRYSYFSLADIQAHSVLKQNLIQHIVAFENFPVSEELVDTEVKSKSLRVGKVEDIEQTNYDLNVIVMPGRELEIKFSYNALTYNKNAIKQLAAHLIQIMEQVIQNPNIRVSEIDLLTAEEKQQILFEFNDTRRPYPSDHTIHRAFKEQAEKTPEAVAVLFEDCELTYRELNIKANQLASKLRKLGVVSETIVGILTERSPEMIIGILGILKAGGAYLPLEPSYPQERIMFMLQDSGSEILLTLSGKGKQMNTFNFSGMVLDLADINSYDSDDFILSESMTADDLAYVMYTSGSTGRPKGVMIEHRNVIRLVKNTNYMPFAENERILLTGALVFDACTFEIWGALLNGLRLYIVPESVILDAVQLGEALDRYHITTMWMTSPLFNQLTQHKPNLFASLNHLLVGGDVLLSGIINTVRSHSPGLNVINVYGPTENTTFSTYFPIDKEYNSIPIGRPIGNSTVYILDSSSRLLPIGAQGEICVGGDGLARGYLNRDDLTQLNFVPNPFIPGEKMYRTGDLGRWLPDGNLEYLGRIDQQVKIRGFRIEPGEIETQLMRHDAVQEAHVTVKSTNDGQKTLCAYISTDVPLSKSDMKTHLTGQLPDYMIPAQYVFLRAFPLTTNGKIDRQALPEPEMASGTDMEYVAPTNEVEQQLADLWQAVLGVEKVGIDDGFFELGGHSLKAIQLVSKMQESNIPLDIHQLLRYQTIRNLAKLLQRGEEGGENTDTLIAKTQEVEQAIADAFGVQAWLHFVSADKQDYLFLQVKPFHTEQVQAITAFIQSRIHPDLHPHYIVRWGTDEPDRIFGTLPTNEEQETLLKLQVDEWLASIAESNISWNTNILSLNAIGCYPLAPAQQYHLQHFTGSGMAIQLDSYLDTEHLNATVQRLLHRHELLRSVLVQSSGAWEWELHPAPEHLSIPIVDLSDQPVQAQRRLLLSIASSLFLEPYELTQSLQYRIVLVRLNLREHLLLFPCSHIIFDATSSDILRRQLLDEYHHPQQEYTIEEMQYRDYVNHIRQGPQGIRDQEISEQFELQRFGENNERIHALTEERNYADTTRYRWTLNLDGISEQHGPAMMWEISLQMAVRFFSSYFEGSDVPLWLTNYGRQYGDRNYFGIVGECIDHIPVVLQEDDMEPYEKRIHTHLDFASRYHLNFFNLIFNAEMEEAYPVSSSFLKKGLGQLPIVFNYLGEGRDNTELLDNLYTESTQTNVNKVIFFESEHIGDILKISLTIPYKENRQYIHQIFQTARDRLLNALTILQ
ncbi:non-ribosomal peptide synthetase [Paenibacillus sp. M-152]|uniref:non-ribosomal peptide synthetase n=1 Tax=Paenibacillus sp. M-152 TaxID=2487928 RepID=UPI000F6F0633|nr:non-ribosomal peptide synthetase [Paenibacillus sp. M-152]AZH29547.1 amino acid adenylation domain-containing protein [Paenibacillus sp. M-152]